MNLNLDWSNHGLANFWGRYGDVTVLVIGAALTAAVVYGLFRMFKTPDKGKRVSTITTVVVMCWTAEGMVKTAIVDWRTPWEFAAIAFFVFEALMLNSGLSAEENRRVTGSPGAAGLFMFVIAASQGTVAAWGAATGGETFFRWILPVLATGQWVVQLVRPRETDSDALKQARAERAAERETTWVWTWSSVAVRLGLKHEGKVTLTMAQRAARIDRMVALADTIALIGAVDKPGRLAKRKLAKARQKLREETRTADADMVAAVAEHVDRANRAEALMVPGAGEPPVAKWAKDLKGPKPPHPGNPDRDQDQAEDEAPVSGAPDGARAETVPALVDAETWTAHRARVELVMATVGDAWWNGPKAMSVDVLQALGKKMLAEGTPNEGLANRLNAQKTASCLRMARYARLFPEHLKTLQAQNPGLEIPDYVSK